MGKYIYETIKEYLMGLINENKNDPRYKLPSENQLAAKFNTTRVTAKRALTALTEEGYIYRMHGKGSFICQNFASPLPAGEKDFVCMFFPNLRSNFITEIIDGATNYLESTGIQLLVCTNNESELVSNSLLMKMVDMGAKGILFFPFDNESYNRDLMLLALNNYPVVFIDRTIPSLDVSSVMSNHFESARCATRTLFEKGCASVAYLTSAPTTSSAIFDRVRGYEQAHIDAGRLIKKANMFYIDDQDPNLTDTIARFLQENDNIDGILSSGDRIGLALYRALRQTGRNVPDDTQVIFYDDEYAAMSDLLPFAPTCIRQNGFRLGSEAARVITNLIRTNNSVNERLHIDCTLLERGSTK